jgi:hypothetical protein
MFDMYVDCIGPRRIGALPGVIAKRRTRHYCVSVAHQTFQQCEFFAPQADYLVFALYPELIPVER